MFENHSKSLIFVEKSKLEYDSAFYSIFFFAPKFKLYIIFKLFSPFSWRKILFPRLLLFKKMHLRIYVHTKYMYRLSQKNLSRKRRPQYRQDAPGNYKKPKTASSHSSIQVSKFSTKVHKVRNCS